MKRFCLILSVIMVLAFSISVIANAADDPQVRIKDITRIADVRDNQLIGYGLVVGLAGTGDSDKTSFTTQSIVNALMKFGVDVTGDKIKVKNIAAVMVTANLPAFARSGDKIDVVVSSIGDAQSLNGGTLLLTPLKAVNDDVYALAQGALSRVNRTVAQISNGALVEKQVPVVLAENDAVSFNLQNPDFNTASNIVSSINEWYGSDIATAADAGVVRVQVPPIYKDNLIGFVAAVNDLMVTPDGTAKIVINERTGTVVMGHQVKISTVSITHKNLNVKVNTPKTTTGTQSVNSKSNNTVQNNSLVLKSSVSVNDLVKALNLVGATADDIISILQAMKAAGAIYADIQII